MSSGVTVSQAVGEGAPARGARVSVALSSPTLLKLFRYGAVSLASTALGATLLVLFVGAWHWPAPLANVTGAFIVLGPVYLVSRRWIWQIDREARIVREALPFWIISLVGVVASSGAAGGASAWAKRLGLSHGLETSLVVGVVLTTYAVLWLLRFFIFDRVLFRR
jgi:putative flippase GtrA